MAQPVIQPSFNAGEWAPQLYSRVDIERYHTAAALLRNFFVDYRGGASTRAGTEYILQAKDSANPVRIIPFQASFTIGYVLEFGNFYIRFYNNGAPVLESAKSITSAAAGPPEVFTSNAHGYLDDDWIYAGSKYYIIANATANTFTLTDLFGTAINTNPFTLPTNAQRIYTLASPYAAADLSLLKFAQNVSTMILCHPDYAPYVLTLTSATNWALTEIVFGATVSAPGGLAAATTLGGGSFNYSYIVTAVDINGQESAPSSPVTLSAKAYLNTTQGTNTVTWNAVSGAQSYNVYKALETYSVAIASGAGYGFIGNVSGLTFNEPYPGIAADFTLVPPIVKNPFQGAGVASLTLGTNDTYTAAPTITIAAPPAGGAQATGHVSLKVTTVAIAAGGTWSAGLCVAGGIVALPNGVRLLITATDVGHTTITAVSLLTAGSIGSGSTPTNPVTAIGVDGIAIWNVAPTFNLTWNIGSLILDSPGYGYASAPAVTFSSGAATATTTLGAQSAGYPSVPAFFQQRLILAAPTNAPQTFYGSQPGSFYNYNISNPVQADDAITASIISGQLGAIKAMIPQPAGLLVLSDQASWLINGGSFGSAITPSTLVANAQSFNGSSDVPPIVSNYDVLYVQSKGASVRDSTYNFYANVFTGTDITIQSSHLFTGYHIQEWCWSEEPYKIVWAVRSDGALLSCTFLKEQEFIGWAHHDTTGEFKSTCTIIENVTQGDVNAVYFVVQRTVQGQSLQYIERMAERYYPNGAADAWCVDAGLQYNGAPATSFSGGEHLAGLSCTGLADGVVIPTFTMPTSGTFTLATPASKVTVGLAFTPQLQTLPIDLGAPTVQGKVKKITGVTTRVSETLGLSIGPDFNHLVTMKDLIVGNVSGMLTGQQTQVVSGLATADAFTLIAPTYTVPGQYCIQQSNPFPATITGVFPEITVGDTK